MTTIGLLKAALEKNKKLYLNLLQELIRIDTENISHGKEGGKEFEGQVYLENLLHSLGFETSRHSIKEEYIIYAAENLFEGNPGHNYSHPSERFNLLGTLKSKERGKSLIFNGHMDTMPANAPETWAHPPLAAHIEGDRLYGLGAADMKSGIMASVMAVRLLQDAGLSAGGDVSVLSVSDEEGGGNGSLSACLDGISADYCIVAECSESTITRAHMGFIIMDIEVKGVALHCGRKWEGENAIEKAIHLIGALGDLEQKWLTQYRHPILPSPSINIGAIQGGAAASTVPDYCLFKICAHILPTMDIKTCIDEIHESIRRRADCDSFLRENAPLCTITQQGNGFEIPEIHPFVTDAVAAFEKTFQSQASIAGSCSGNDARLMQNIAKIPTLVIGPGTLLQCHAVNEHVQLNDYFDMILLYAAIILQINNKL